MSVLIREPERQLGLRLFDRTTRQVRLTWQGSEVLAVTKSSLTAVDEVISRIEDAPRGKPRRITVGATPWVAANVLPLAIKAFREMRPELRIGIFDGTIGASARQVEKGKVDLGPGIFKKTPDLRRAYRSFVSHPL